MARIAFLTLAEVLDYVIDDHLVITELERRGHEVEQIPWTDEHADWARPDMVIVRTTWDYHHQPERFLSAIDRISQRAQRFENDAELIRWNLDKRYLRELKAAGVPIVPSRWGFGGEPADFAREAEALQSEEVVVKPTVSANAMDTMRLPGTLTDAQAEQLSATFAGRHWFAQPFVASILSEGETSVFYFGGRYSHTISKVPRAGDFRVQEEHGGVIVGVEPSGEVLRVAEQVMAALDSPPLQARVDLVRLADGSLALMELELIEPSLYFRTSDVAAAHFADAVESRLELAEN
ncbi:MAG: hypothetical protein JNJ45_04670 [Chthonomonas sp.]|nr:hypothetical protein [Chthonomonas sp.]